MAYAAKKIVPNEVSAEPLKISKKIGKLRGLANAAL